MYNIIKYFKPNKIAIHLKQSLNNIVMAKINYIKQTNIVDTIEGDLKNPDDAIKFSDFFAKYKDGLISISIEGNLVLKQEHELLHGNKLELLMIKLIDFDSNDSIDLIDGLKTKETLQAWLNYLANFPNPVKEIDAIYEGKKYKIRNKEIYSLIMTDIINYYFSIILYCGSLLLILIFLVLFYKNYEMKYGIEQLKVNYGMHQ